MVAMDNYFLTFDLDAMRGFKIAFMAETLFPKGFKAVFETEKQTTFFTNWRVFCLRFIKVSFYEGLMKAELI